MAKERTVTHAISGKTKGADNYRSPSEHLLDQSGDVVQTEPVRDGLSDIHATLRKEISEAREEMAGQVLAEAEKTSSLRTFFESLKRQKNVDRNHARESSRITRGRANRGRSSR